jgi:hypothetical protein
VGAQALSSLEDLIIATQQSHEEERKKMVALGLALGVGAVLFIWEPRSAVRLGWIADVDRTPTPS